MDRYFSDPHAVDAHIMSGVVFEDSYGGAGLKIILSNSEGSQKEKVVWTKGREAIEKLKRTEVLEKEKKYEIIQNQVANKSIVVKEIVRYFFKSSE